MSKTYNAGIVTAYGAAVRGGYTGTYEQFCLAMAEFSEDASVVVEAAENISTYTQRAETAADNAEASQSAAAASEANAAASQASAIASATAASASESAAALSKAAAQNAEQAALAASTAAQNAEANVNADANRASAAADAAEASETAAAASESAAASSESNAAASETNAASSATNAASSASAAAASETAAAGSASAAATSATNAAASEAEAKRVEESIPEDYSQLSADVQGLIEIVKAKTPKSWKEMQDIVRAGLAPKVFNIRDQVVCEKDGVQLVWDIIGIDHDTPADPQFTHSLTLQLHNCFNTTVQFDAPEAFYYCEEELPAGTYYFIIDPTYEAANNDLSSYQFTLTQAVPAGGQLTFPWGSNAKASTIKVLSFQSATSTTAIEQVSVTEGTTGTNLGTLTAAGDFEHNLNSIHRVRYGSNNYGEGAMRQFLGANGAAGTFWTPQTKFDRPPTWLATLPGWMNGMDEDFLAVLGKTHIVVSRNTVCDGGGSDEFNDTFFLLSRSEAYAGNEVASVIEGEPYPYYSDYSDLSAAGTGNDTNRIKYRNGSAQYWWLRSPSAGGGNGVRVIYSAGNLNNSNAYVSSGVAPACNII